MKIFCLSLLIALNACSMSVNALSDEELKTTVEKRLLGDRTNACFAVAVIAENVSRAYVCADPKNNALITSNSAFEIGSVTKTMTAALLADLVLQGKASLDDPLSNYVPKGVSVPSFEGKPILLKHIVTHTSGLPVVPEFGSTADNTNPYAKIDAVSLYKTLSNAKLTQAPGTKFEYSNFAMMVLSEVIAARTGSDFETLIHKQLFEPVGMKHSYINKMPTNVTAAQGHTPDGKNTPAWTFQTNASGVGGVRSTLDDMVLFVQAQLNKNTSSITPALQLTQKPILTESNGKIAMNWMMAPLDAHMVYLHEGGTGGFSSLVVFDQTTQRGVVVLSNTALTSIGGLSSVANHLLDSRLPLGKARKVAQPSATLLASIVGNYDLMPGMQIQLTEQNGRLYAQATGQEKYEMGYDSEGDFYPLAFDAVLRPKQRADGSYSLLFLQSGAALPLKKIDSNAKAQDKALTASQLAEYVGTYPLMQNFDLKVFVEGGDLKAQASGQGAFKLDSLGSDNFSADSFGISIHFVRDSKGKVVSLKLLQGGNILEGKKK